MKPVEFEEQAVRMQLDLVLGSPGFVRNDRMASFLRFVVERHLEGRDQELKESVIAIEVFGRAPDHNPRRDPIVRTEAGRLRARLSEYYVREGSGDALVIEIPKGGYAPAFRLPAPASATERAPARKTRDKRWIWRAVVLPCLTIVLTAAGWWLFQYANAPISIAVLPLTNLSQYPGNDYLADGLTAELIRNLSIIEGLAVRSQTSSFALKGKPRNVREAGKQLDADHILEGSVVRERQHLRINVQLIRVRDDFPLWSGRYDSEGLDALAIQDEISRGIVNSLRLKLGSGRRRYEINAEVYDLYLRARSLSIGRGLGGINKNTRLLEEVIAKDPSFAPAHADLAVAYASRSGQFAFDIPAEVSKMRASAEKALLLDPLLAEAHDAQGIIKARDAQWGQSEKSFRRAIDLDPNRSESRANFALFLLLPLNRVPEALRELRLAERADPLSHEIHFRLAYVLISAGHYEEAAYNCEKLNASGTLKSECLGRARLGQGRIGEAIHVLESGVQKLGSNGSKGRGNQVKGELGHAYARAGRREEAENLAASTSKQNPFNHALIFAGLGDKDRTFQALDLAASSGPFRIGRALTYPEFALLRGDPRVKALRRKVGLPE